MKQLPLALAVAVVLLGYLGYGYARKTAREGWDLVPIIVVAEDVNAGTVITTDMIAQRPVPSRFTSPNVIRPDLYSYVIGQKVLIGLKKGEALRWTQFGQPRPGGAGGSR